MFSWIWNQRKFINNLIHLWKNSLKSISNISFIFYVENWTCKNSVDSKTYSLKQYFEVSFQKSDQPESTGWNWPELMNTALRKPAEEHFRKPKHTSFSFPPNLQSFAFFRTQVLTYVMYRVVHARAYFYLVLSGEESMIFLSQWSQNGDEECQKLLQLYLSFLLVGGYVIFTLCFLFVLADQLFNSIGWMSYVESHRRTASAFNYF